MAELNLILQTNICKQCGKPQVAPDPDTGELVQAIMLHYGVDSYHVDCLPFELEQLHRPQHSEVIDAAKAGVRGEELRAISLSAAKTFAEKENAWLADESVKFAASGKANEQPTHVMYAQDGE